MNEVSTSALLAPAILMLAILSACGSSPEDATVDMDEYCASVDFADELCDEVEASEASSNPTPSEEQTGDSNFNPFSFKPGFRMTM